MTPSMPLRASRRADPGVFFSRRCPWRSMNRWDRTGCAPRPEPRAAPARARRSSGRSRWWLGLAPRSSSPATSITARRRRHADGEDRRRGGRSAAGRKIRPEDLKLFEWPADHLPVGAVRDPKEVAERILLSRVLAGQPVLPGMLAAKNAGNGLAALIPSEHAGHGGAGRRRRRRRGLHSSRRSGRRAGHPAAQPPGRRDDLQGVHAEREGAGRRTRGRGQRSGAHARQPGDGGDAAGLAAGLRAAGAGLCRGTAPADAAELDRRAPRQHAAARWPTS